MDAGHVLVVVDSCFAGKIFTQKGSEDEDTTADDRDKKDILKDYKMMGPNENIERKEGSIKELTKEGNVILSSGEVL